jgi:hypothetical protein
MDTDKMIRVSRSNPCPVCGKPDWCLVAPDGAAAICQRVSEGAVKICGQAGWLHVMHDWAPLYKSKSGIVRLISSKPLYRQWDPLVAHYQKRIRAYECTQYAEKNGLSERSLDQLYIGLNSQGYTFPMKNGAQHVIGIQIRRLDGGKLCVPGSRLGLFIPRSFGKSERVMICEGLSDTAAALDLGFNDAVGRASCQSNQDDLIQLCQGQKVVIVGDNDPPGRMGAETLAWKLALHCPEVKVIYPPDFCKDLRDWKNDGVTKKEINWAINRAPIRKIQIRQGEPS